MTRSRSSYLGSSDAPPIIGVPSYGRTEVDVWEAKLRDVDDTRENSAMRWGTILEPVILAEYERQTGRKVSRRRRQRFHPEYPFIGATIDGETDDRIVEAKFTPYSNDIGEPGDGAAGLTPYMRVQVQEQMLVTGHVRTDVPVLVRGHDLRIFEVEADPNYQRDLLEELVEWWQVHVVQRVPPEGQSAADRRAIVELTRRDDGSTMVPGEEALEVLRSYRGVRLAEAQVKARRAELEADIAEAMGTASRLVMPDGSRIDYKSHLRREVDWKVLAGVYRRMLERGESGVDLDVVQGLYTEVKTVRPMVARWKGEPELTGPQEQEAISS